MTKPPIDVKELGKRVRALRLRQGIGVQELADRVGVSRVCLWEIEEGRRPKTSVETVAGIASALGVTLADLLDKHGETD